jgi:hypothetical protein
MSYVLLYTITIEELEYPRTVANLVEYNSERYDDNVRQLGKSVRERVNKQQQCIAFHLGITRDLAVLRLRRFNMISSNAQKILTVLFIARFQLF